MFSIPFKVSPAEAECVTCIIQTKNICWDCRCHLPGSGIFTFQAECQLFQFSYPVDIGCSPPLCSTLSLHWKNAWELEIKWKCYYQTFWVQLAPWLCPTAAYVCSEPPALPPLSPCFLWQDFKYSNSRRFLLNLIDLKCVCCLLIAGKESKIYFEVIYKQVY